MALFAVREEEAKAGLGPQASGLGPEAKAGLGLQASGLGPEAQKAKADLGLRPEAKSAGGRVPASLLVAIGVFTLGNSTDALLILRAQTVGVPTPQLPILWALLHVVRSALSWPLGRAADRLGRRGALAAGWLWYAACYAGFALARSPLQMWLLFAAYGLVAGLTEGSERALIASAVPGERRGRALGVYNLVSGIGLLLASVLAGEVWEHGSPQAALLLGAGLAFAAAALLAAAHRPAGAALAP
jgi:MFS family permease